MYTPKPLKHYSIELMRIKQSIIVIKCEQININLFTYCGKILIKLNDTCIIALELTIYC